MPDVQVNGTRIAEAAILAEAQYHPAPSTEQAVASATEALVVRELLLQEARRQSLVPSPETDDQGRRETDEEALIRQLLAAEVSVPVADTETCRRYYDNNRGRFKSPDLYEAAHILFAADPKDAVTYADAVAAAEQTIAVIQRDPKAFAAIARSRSDCVSGKQDGRLGQVGCGDTVPEVETFLVALEPGQLCPVPIKSRYGAHVLRLDHKIEGRHLPFETVRERIAGYLHEASWRRAVAQYIKLLAGRAEIQGAQLDAEAGMLVQ